MTNVSAASSSLVLRSHAAPVSCLAFLSPEILLSGDAGGRLLAWDLDQGRVVRQLGEHEPNGVLAIACEGDGRRFLSQARDGMICVWRDFRVILTVLTESECFCKCSVLWTSSSAAAATTTKGWVACTTGDETVVGVWSFDAAEGVELISTISARSVDDDGARDRDDKLGMVMQCSLNRRPMRDNCDETRQHEEEVFLLNLYEIGILRLVRLLLGPSFASSETAPWSVLSELRVQPHLATPISFDVCPPSSTIAKKSASSSGEDAICGLCCGSSSKLYEFVFPLPRSPEPVPPRISRIVLLENGKRTTKGARDDDEENRRKGHHRETAEEEDLASSSVVKSEGTGGNQCVYRPLDGRIVAVACWDHSVRLFHARTSNHLGTLVHHRDSVTAIAFHPIDGRLYSGSKDKTIAVWNVFVEPSQKSVPQMM